jgi:hypothetical protein
MPSNLDLSNTPVVLVNNLSAAGHFNSSNSDAVGVLTVSAGQTTKEHDFTIPYASTPVVLLTPLGNPTVTYWIVVNSGSFTVTLASALGSDLQFGFLVIGHPN